MASQPGVFNPQAFTDSGAPAAGYRLYTLAQGTTTHKAAFTDAAGLVAHTYSSDGSGGLYIGLNSRGELAAPLFLASGAYDLTLKTPAGATVWTRYARGADDVATSLYTDLAAEIRDATGAGGAAIVGYLPGGASAVARDVQDKLREFVSVKDFGATGDGTTNDLAAFLAAFAASKRVHVPDGTYWLGSYSASSRIIDLTAAGNDIEITTGGAVELTCTSTANVNPVFFYLRNNSGFRCGRIRFRDLNYDRAASRGAIGFTMDAATSDWSGVSLDAVYALNCYTAVLIATQTTTRVRSVNIGLLSAVACNRGFNAQNQGDDVTIGLLFADQCERAYFAYGVTGHRANIFARRNFGTTGVVNISRAVGGYNTSDIEINYTARDTVFDVYHVNINHIDLLGGEISDIRLNIDVRSASPYDSVRFVNYAGSGGSETSAASANIVYDIDIAGSCDAQARPITAVASYASKLLLKLTPGRFFEASASLLGAFNLSVGVLSAPAAAEWSAPTPPSLGNGSLARDYSVSNGLCTVNYSLTIGSTTTTGTGDWTFKAPAVATAAAQGAALVVDGGTAHYVGAARIEAGSDLVSVYAGNAAANAVRSNTPMSWANGDRLTFSITYPISG